MEKLERAIDSIQRTIEEDGGNLVIKMKVILESSLVCFDHVAYIRLLSRKPFPRQKSKTWLNSWPRLAKRMLKYQVTMTMKSKLVCSEPFKIGNRPYCGIQSIIVLTTLFPRYRNIYILGKEGSPSINKSGRIDKLRRREWDIQVTAPEIEITNNSSPEILYV